MKSSLKKLIHNSRIFRLAKLLKRPVCRNKMGSNVCKNGQVSPEITVLKEEEIQLLLSSTSMNREQIVDFHKNFLKDCPYGIMTKKEFCRLFKELHVDASKSQRVEKFSEFVFNAFDSDSNDIISFMDFVVCYSITSSGHLKQKIELAFKIYDLNKDNVIEKNEMLKVLEVLFDLTGVSEAERRQNSPKKIVETMMVKLDTNRDNVLQIDEFVKGCLEDKVICSILIDPMFNC